MAKDLRFRYAMITAGLVHGLVIWVIGFSQRGNVVVVVQPHAPFSISLDLTALDAKKSLSELGSPNTRSLNEKPNREASQRISSHSRVRNSSHSEYAFDTPSTDEGDAVTIESDPSPTGPGPEDPDRSASANISRLSREQLGLGVGDYSQVLPTTSPVEMDKQTRLALSQQLERSIRQDTENQAGELGLGKEGPILTRLEQLVQQNPVDLTGFATIHARLRTGGAIELELLGTTSDRYAWNQLLERAKSDLLALKLSPPQGSQGIDWVIRVESRIQMPSGADPGFSVKLFGVPLRKSKGKRSSGVEVLSSLPKLELDESVTSERERGLSQRLKLEIVKIPLDPADLSGKHSRVTSARVLKRTLF